LFYDVSSYYLKPRTLYQDLVDSQVQDKGKVVPLCEQCYVHGEHLVLKTYFHKHCSDVDEEGDLRVVVLAGMSDILPPCWDMMVVLRVPGGLSTDVMDVWESDKDDSDGEEGHSEGMAGFE
jgi:hypothetical protein